MADPIYVYPVVQSAQVDTAYTCDSCGALMVRLSVGGLHDLGAVQLPDILICPDCLDPARAVDEWRAKVRGH